MGIINHIAHRLTVRKLNKILPAYLNAIKGMQDVDPYTCVVDPRVSNDPRLLENIRVFGTYETDNAFVRIVEAQLRAACSVTVHQERLPLFTLDGCTASKSSPRQRTLVEWGKSMNPNELRLPLNESPSVMLARCLRHTFPPKERNVYMIDHLTWSEHGRYWHNSDGSHHLALAIALIHE